MIKHLIHQHRKVSLHLSNHNHKYLEILVISFYKSIIYITELPSLPGSEDELEKVKRNLESDLKETIVISDSDDECGNQMKQ